MNIEEAKRIAADIRAQRYNPNHYTTEFAAQQACLVLADGLRAAEGQVAHMNAKLDATHTNRCFNCEQTVTEATSARQAAAVAPKPVTPSKSMIPDSTCQCGHPADKHIECVDFTSARGCFADDCNCTGYQATMREVILPEGWSQGTPVASDLEAPYEWYRKPPSGRWLFVRQQSPDTYRWYRWTRKPQEFGAKILDSGRAPTPELAMEMVDTSERVAG